VMPGVRRVASLLKRWLLGTHQGSVRGCPGWRGIWVAVRDVMVTRR